MKLVAIGLIWALGWVMFILSRAGRWPEPVQHPYWCQRCRRGYKTGPMYAMHLKAQHGEEA